ncbi:DUF7281 domain-containing protein [Vibrio porteresiae]|uniref:DUF7281 domain-containing protein n=1 Tax=Vibrio porteresiae DSM 19223 TaxID=1123496 RepID=A0ABZ0QAF4_9VIBR|nr:hypothetical protein [Vibrio porteresiae]WPC73399.1 hypothetical protein R8Z52_14965 [Vibrio porteresiae DSM 19223]
MDKRTLTLLQGIVQHRKQVASASKALRDFSEHYGLGQLRGKEMHFTHQELDEIHRLLQLEVDANVLQLTLPQERIATSALVDDEKWATGNVFGQVLTVARAHHLPIRLKHGEVTTPNDTSFNVLPEQLDLTVPLMVIENGSMLTQWSGWVSCLPETLQHCLLVYRGHGRNQSHLKHLLSQLPEDQSPRFGYFDFDLAGILMAERWYQQTGAVPILPVNYAEFPTLIENQTLRNKHATFVKQVQKYGKNPEFSHPQLANVYDFIVEHELAIMQEQLAAKGIKLSQV